MTFSLDDQRRNQPLDHLIPINGDGYNGTATLRSAVRLNQAFARGDSSVQFKRPALKPLTKSKAPGAWPKWETPLPESILAVPKMATPYVRFLHPNIVARIVDDNEQNRSQWRKKMINKSIDSEFYLWDRSSCAFPGIRRYAGSKEIAFFRKQNSEGQVDITDAFRLDDNSFPKHYLVIHI